MRHVVLHHPVLRLTAWMITAGMVAVGVGAPAYGEDTGDVPSEIGFEPTDDPNAPLEPGPDASDDSSNWNLYWWATDLPAASLGPVTGSVAVGGTSEVCSMRLGSQTRTAPPWDFTIQPGVPGTVAITQCNGVTDSLDYAVQPGLTVRGASFSAKKAKRWVISVSSALPTDGLDIVVQSRTGKRLAAQHVDGTMGSLVVPKKAWGDAGRGRLVVTYPDGRAMRLPVRVTGLPH